MDKLYSEGLEHFAGELPLLVAEAVKQITAFFKDQECPILKWDDQSIVVKVLYDVSLPTRGAVGGIDIRAAEPILIHISLKYYPDNCPVVMSDRIDFPKKSLPHLYAREEGKPAAFCLVRNDPNEWFSTVKLTDLLTVVNEWLYKAAAGILVNDGEEWDPLRLEGFVGHIVYRYDIMTEVVKKDLRFLPGYPFAVMLSSVQNGRVEHDVIFKIINAIPFIQFPTLLGTFKKIHTDQEEGMINQPFLSLLIWDAEQSVESEYCVDMPDNYLKLKAYFSIRGIDLDSILSIYIKSMMQLARIIPVVHAIRRPGKLIGFDDNIEFINFVIKGDFSNGSFPSDSEVRVLSHIEPFSEDLAEKMTEEKRNVKTLYIGAGSLGSKMVMHDVRSGKIFLGVIDHDQFLQHNLTRHALYSNHVGKNKAEALIEEAKSFFENSIIKNLLAYPVRIHLVNLKTYSIYEWLIDTTASFSTENFLSSTSLPTKLKIARCEIADSGNLGLCYIEGENRNPRIDDLVNLTYYLATENNAVQKWRENDNKKDIKNISVGLGCSSTTSVMSDDTISFHSSSFSRFIYGQQSLLNPSTLGSVYLSSCNNGNSFEITSAYIKVEAFDMLTCSAGSKWEVRMKNGLTTKLRDLCKANSEKETGGVLIGICNYKTNTIHVLDIIVEPKGSSGTITEFTRGIGGLGDQIDQIKKITGGMIGYIGEWHTHPKGGEGLSQKDRDTIATLQKLNKKIPIPTCSVIVTPNSVSSYTFD